MKAKTRIEKILGLKKNMNLFSSVANLFFKNNQKKSLSLTSKLILPAVILVSVVGVASKATAKIQTVERVSLAEYAGTWYRISSNPVPYEPKCACARQVLTPAANSKIAVYNSCNALSDGKLKEIRGSAVATDASGSKLSVDFGLPWKGDYWVIALDSEYRYAVVTDRFGFSLYILSREPTLSDELYKKAVQEASQQVSVKRLVIAGQSNCHYPPAN